MQTKCKWQEGGAKIDDAEIFDKNVLITSSTDRKLPTEYKIVLTELKLVLTESKIVLTGGKIVRVAFGQNERSAQNDMKYLCCR